MGELKDSKKRKAKGTYYSSSDKAKKEQWEDGRFISECENSFDIRNITYALMNCISFHRIKLETAQHKTKYFFQISLAFVSELSYL